MTQSQNIYSKLMEELHAGRFVVTGELEPEKIGNLGTLYQEAREIEPYVVAANITDNPGSFIRVDSLATSILIKQNTQIEPIFQLTCRDKNRIGLASALLGAASAGIKNILVLTGDHPSLGDTPQAKGVFDLDSAQLLKLAREVVDDQRVFGKKIKESKNTPVQFHIGIGANPNSSHPEIELAKIKKKVDMGAEFIQTQVIYDLEKAGDFLKQVHSFGVPVLVGLFPLKTYTTAYWFNKLVPGVEVPEDILTKFKEVDDANLPKSEKKEKYDEINVELFNPIISELKNNKIADGLHITAVNYSRIYHKLFSK